MLHMSRNTLFIYLFFFGVIKSNAKRTILMDSIDTEGHKDWILPVSAVAITNGSVSGELRVLQDIPSYIVSL